MRWTIRCLALSFALFPNHALASRDFHRITNFDRGGRCESVAEDLSGGKLKALADSSKGQIKYRRGNDSKCGPLHVLTVEERGKTKELRMMTESYRDCMCMLHEQLLHDVESGAAKIIYLSK